MSSLYDTCRFVLNLVVLTSLSLPLALGGCSKKSSNNDNGSTDATAGSVTSKGGVTSSNATAIIPPEPANLSAAGTGPDTMEFKWSGDASTTMLYELEICAGNPCTEFVAATNSPVGGSKTGDVETGLSPDTPYQFRMRSVNGRGASEWVLGPQTSTLLLAPTSLEPLAKSESTITMGWTESLSPHSGTALERCAGAGCTDFQAVFGSPFAASEHAHVEPGLEAATTYRFRARAVTATNVGAWVESGDVTTATATGEPAPANVTIGAVTDTTATVMWTAAPAGALVYDVERCDGANCTAFAPAFGSPVAASSSTFQATDLSASSIYTFRVRATGAVGSSAWITSASVETAPAAPTSLAAIASSASVNLSWTVHATDENGYEVQRCSGSACSNFVTSPASPLVPGATTLTDGALTGSTVYRYRLRAFRAAATSRWLESGDVTTAPAAPTAMTIVALSDRAVSLTWTKHATDDLLVEVQRCDGLACSSFAAAPGSPLPAGSTAYSVGDLAPSTNYAYRVRATAAAGSSDWLTSAAFKSAPAAPSSLANGAVTTNTVALNWLDNASDETGYEVERCAGAGCADFAAIAGSPVAANTVGLSDTGLSGGTTYLYRVRAVRGTVQSEWVMSPPIATTVMAASCAAPATAIIDRGLKSGSANVGRGLFSDVKVIPGTRPPATAFYDGSVSGGAAAIKISWWNGSAFRVETVAGDSHVGVGSATWVRLAFLSNGIPMVFWTTGSATVRGAMRSAAFGAPGTWSTAVLDTVAGAASRSLEVAVSPLNQVGLVYLTNSASTGRARFIACGAGCASLSGFTAMTAVTDAVEASNVIPSFMDAGIAWCKHDAATFYPAVVYPGSAGTAVRYASCLGALSSCKTAAGWSGQATTIVATTGATAKLYLDPTIAGDAPKVVTRNAANTQLQAFQINQACDAAAPYAVTAANPFGAATSGTSWLKLMKSGAGTFHVITNLGTSNINYHNSVSTVFATTAWNAAGNVDSVFLPAAGAGAGGADINVADSQIYAAYGGANAPFNITLGVVADTTVSSNLSTANYYTLAPDTSGAIDLETATGQTRNVQAASTSDGRLAVVYVDNSIGAPTGAALKYGFRDGAVKTVAWRSKIIPGTVAPMAPALAFDERDRPWISYYDAGALRFYLVTNSESDGSGDWSSFQFPINTKASTAVAPATDDTAVAMVYANGVAKPLMIVLNSTATGGAGVRSALFDPSTGSFVGFATLDTLPSPFATRLSAAFDRNGNVVVAYYDLTATKVKFNYSTNGLTWLGTPALVSAAGTGREGLSIKLNPANGRPGISYYDRANNMVYYTACAAALTTCSSSANWVTTTVNAAAGVSGIPVANEQMLNTSLTYSTAGTPFVTYMTGVGAPAQLFGVADPTSGSFVTTPLGTTSSAAVPGAATVNFAMTGFNESSTRTPIGTFLSAFVGPNNWLYATTCGD